MADDLPVSFQLNRIHKFLREELEPFSSEEILKRTGVNIERNQEILDSLTGDASKVIRETDGRWRWASKYQLRNIADLIALMSRTTEGIVERELLDSYKGIKGDIEKLKNSKAVYSIKSGSRFILFRRDTDLEMDISKEVKDMYKVVRVPEDAMEIHRYLVSQGLKDTTDTRGVKIAQPITRKRPSSRKDTRRRKRRIKLTNTHMENSNIDLSKDYNAGRDSAFS